MKTQLDSVFPQQLNGTFKKVEILSKVYFLHYGKMGGCTDVPDLLPDGSLRQ